MISGSCIQITTKKFQKLDGEDSELINAGMYGKALCKYLEDKLKAIGYNIPFYCNEDWGWWIEIKGYEIKIGLLIYCNLDENEIISDYAIMPSVDKERVWSWRRFRWVNTLPTVNKIITDLKSIFKNDSDIEAVISHDGYPF
jgi:hypothetical protein